MARISINLRTTASDQGARITISQTAYTQEETLLRNNVGQLNTEIWTNIDSTAAILVSSIGSLSGSKTIRLTAFKDRYL